MAGEIGHWCGIDFTGGGLGAVDKIDGAALQDKEGFLVITPTVFAPFSLDIDSGAGENSPQRIAPNTNPGDKRWLLTGGVFAGLTIYGDVDLVKTSGSLDLSLTITGAGTYAATQRCTTDDSSIMFGAFDDGYAAVANYAGQTVIQITNADWIVAAMTAGKEIKFHTGGRDAGHLRMTIGDNVVTLGGAINVGGNVTISKTVPVIILNDTQDDGETWSIRSGTPDPGDFKLRGHGNDVFLITGTISTNSLVINDGNVGINNANPGSQFDVNGDVNTSDVYKVDDVQVISNQGAVVADATDPATTMARLNDLIARCRAHGLIAT